MQIKIALLGLAASVPAAAEPHAVNAIAPECTTAAVSLVGSFPKLKGALSSAWSKGNVTVLDSCTIMAPFYVTKALSSYIGKVSAWASSRSSDILAIQTNCANISGMPEPGHITPTCEHVVIQTLEPTSRK